MRRRRYVWVSVLVTTVLLCCGGGSVLAVGSLFDQGSTNLNTVGCGSNSTIKVNSNLKPAGPLDAEQTKNAASIILAGQQMNVPTRGWVIAIAVAMQESNLRVLANPAVPESLALPHDGSGEDHDSVGLFQQRPSWGTTKDLMDPVASAKKFYAKMLQIKGWTGMALTDVAQIVQVSAFPDAYAKWENESDSVVNSLTNGAARASLTATVTNTGSTALPCAQAGQISASGWTQPVKAPITSGFRTPERPTHNGVDLGAALGTPIVAAASGIVRVAECDPETGNCDVPGSAATPGCGYYVDIQHADGVITRYCHMHTHPLVQVGQHVNVGQQLGIVGDSGNADGAHLHFEVHLDNDPNSSGAVDPIPFMQEHGAPLGGKS
jgi:murein DD-endopeptidase MepM/ murein hydrolase activator NlpD